MSRTIDTLTLDNAAQYYASLFMRDAGVRDRKWVMGQFHNFTFKDEFDHMVKTMGDHLGRAPLSDFKSIIDKMAKDKPRKDEVFEKLLADKLAINFDGDHITGKIGSTNLGSRYIKVHTIEIETIQSNLLRKKLTALGMELPPRETTLRETAMYWPIYAGEVEERLAYSGVADDLPDGAAGMPVGALNTRLSNELALAMADQITLRMDEGTGAGIIEGRDGTQPADPDTAVTGVLGFTLICSDPAFPAAADGAPGGVATASAITDDSSADATITLGYCRASATNDSITPLDDHIDGEAGTAGADWNFNTLAIVAGAVVSATSWVVTVPES